MTVIAFKYHLLTVVGGEQVKLFWKKQALCRQFPSTFDIGRVLFAFLNVPGTHKSSFQKEQKRVDIYIYTLLPVANQRTGKVFTVS